MLLKNKAWVSLVTSMVIFGTIGIFRKYIPFPSSLIAFSRGIIGFAFLLFFLWITRKPFSVKKIGKRILPLCISGAIMGFNWILLFEAYNFTSIATATLCYYMAPIFVIIVSPFLFGEKLGMKKILCAFGAVAGMIFVSGITKEGFGSFSETKGILLGLGAAVLYASVVVMNKRTPDVPSFEKTVVQLGSSAAVIFPYILLTEDLFSLELTAKTVLLLLIVGIVHTGIAYVLYFGSIGKLSAQTTAIFSYVDPVSAIFFSAVFLNEKLSFSETVGAVLVLGCAILSETEIGTNKKRV